MWIINAIVLHVLLLGSIFVIYFRSPVLTGLRPQPPLSLEAPARRLVLIVTDGLRAESFFRHNCSNVPHLRSLMRQQGGLVGVSHTRVPTESRPGHIALIAGLYEDPSAVTRGWKENPIDFDTVFNRSHKTYAWGANDVLHIFARVGSQHRFFFEVYDHELDFSGRDKTYDLDEWVFERVRKFLRRKAESLREEHQIIFFLHLLGLDTAGHVHKPGSVLFLENLQRTEQGIVEIYQYFEETFSDGRTAYVLTSDHGMTNSGSHGAGDQHETETPFFVWGAGVAKVASSSGKTIQVDDRSVLPLHELEQAQFAPFMSALIGVAPPMNNFGTLPHEFLNTSDEYKAHAAHSNALQLLEQYTVLLREHRTGLLSEYLPAFKLLDENAVDTYLTSTNAQLASGAYSAIFNSSHQLMRTALEGIDYYHGYYRRVLLLSTTATFVGWLWYLLQLLIYPSANPKSKSKTISEWRPSISLCAIGVMLVVLATVQCLPLSVAFFLILPVFVWQLAVGNRQRQLIALGHRNGLLYAQLIMLVVCAELLVLTFFERKAISLGFLLFAVADCSARSVRFGDIQFYLWLLLVLALSAFPLLPPSVGYTNTPLLLLGICVTSIRPYLTKARINVRDKLIVGVSLANTVLCVYQHSNRIGISRISQMISWAFLLYVMLSLFMSESDSLKKRLELIFFKLSSLYVLFCTSYESLFVVMLCSELMLRLATSRQQQIQCSDLLPSPPYKLQSCLRLAYTILLYTFFSFFGSGNMASVSSFDPNIIRCFLTTFSPFVIMTLVILKLIIPVILIVAIVFGMSWFARVYEQRIFICLLLVCDIMGLNFLFLVRNQGSWLEIGTSISHFVIMESTTLVLLLFTCLAKLLLHINAVTVNKLK